MLLWILLIGILFFLSAVFYKQTVQEYKLNQIEWIQIDSISELIDEGTPFIIRNTPQSPVWNMTDIRSRDTFKELADWAAHVKTDAIMPWHSHMASHYASLANMDPWIDETWIQHIPFQRRLIPRELQLWAGGRGLYQERAAWVAVMPTEGTIIATVMTTKEDKYLPSNWRGRFADSFTQADTPYVSQIKYLDIKLRAGTVLFLPAHWKLSWQTASEEELPFVCIMHLHTPISKLASLIPVTASAASAASA